MTGVLIQSQINQNFSWLGQMDLETMKRPFNADADKSRRKSPKSWRMKISDRWSNLTSASGNFSLSGTKVRLFGPCSVENLPKILIGWIGGKLNEWIIAIRGINDELFWLRQVGIWKPQKQRRQQQQKGKTRRPKQSEAQAKQGEASRWLRARASESVCESARARAQRSAAAAAAATAALEVLGGQWSPNKNGGHGWLKIKACFIALTTCLPPLRVIISLIDFVPLSLSLSLSPLAFSLTIEPHSLPNNFSIL